MDRAIDRAGVFRDLGGVPGCRALAEAFYARVARDPLLRPLFPGKSLHCAIEEFSAFLVQYLGGPAEHSQRRWWLSLRESHQRFRIGVRERDAWMGHMTRTVDGFPAVRSALLGFFEESSTYLVNGDGAVSTGHSFALDEAVAAVRAGEADRTIALTATCDRGVRCGLLALMIAIEHRALVEYALNEIRRDTALLSERYAGRTLLHVAAGAGKFAVVKQLLELGADPNAPDGGAHPPLYSVANECRAGGGDIVRALVRAGARVNAADGVQRCTALHMAARRGNVEVGQALLQRALNCRKTAMAEFLRIRC